VLRPERSTQENTEIKNVESILDVFQCRLRGTELVLGRLEPLVPRPARVAQELVLALQLQAEIDREGFTYRELAERHSWSRMKACRLLRLAKLPPDIQAEVAALTATVAGEPIDRDTLTWIAEAPDWRTQRKRFDALTRTWRMLLDSEGPTSYALQFSETASGDDVYLTSQNHLPPAQVSVK
jgi:hypothetical protein